MTFKQTFETIQNSEIFKEFKKKNPKAELVAGIFVIDFLNKEDKKSLDYKKGEEIFTFNINEKNEIEIKEDKLINDPKLPKLTKIKPKVKIEIDELKSIAGTKALAERISAKFQKIIAVLQMYEKKQVWNLTCMLEGLIILQIIIDSETGRIIKFERKSMMDFIRKK